MCKILTFVFKYNIIYLRVAHIVRCDIHVHTKRTESFARTHEIKMKRYHNKQ